MKLVGLLRREGPLTATQAAEILGESSGTTSFHLRQLAKYGLVEEAGGGTGRQKPWRATALYTSLPDVTTSPEMAEASAHVRAVVANRYHEQLLDWIGRAADEPTRWQRAASFSDYLLYVTADELEELVGQVTGLIERYADRVADRSARPANSRLVTYLNLAMPARDDGTDRPTP
jgi:predicted ArsR family transcriptional regulator